MLLNSKINLLSALVFLATIFLFSNVVTSQNNSWTTKTPMPTPRYAAAACTVDGIIYVIGGHSKASYPNAVATVEAYDPATDTWTTKTSMPTARQSLAACVVGGKIYAIGGDNNPNVMGDVFRTVEEYDPSTDTWQPKSPMLIAQAYFDGCALNGKIYVAGGGGLRGSGAVRSLFEFDPATDTWERKEILPSSRSHLALCSLNGLVYAIGGAVNPTADELSLNDVYDPNTNSWSSRKDMPTARGELTTSVIEGKIYAIGGFTHGLSTKPNTAVEAYDPITDNWLKMTDMPTPKFWHSRAVVDGKIYIIGGATTNSTAGITDAVEMYDPSLDLGLMLGDICINKCYAEPGCDSVCVSIILHNDPTELAVYAEIQSPDQAAIEKLSLYDDGNHNDGQAGDFHYANFWPVPDIEQHYLVDMRVTKTNPDTRFQLLNNVVSFTTIGPLVHSNHSITTTSVNPGDRIRLELELKNSGLVATATNVRANLVCLDSSMKVNSVAQFFSDIAPGEVGTSTSKYSIIINESYSAGTNVPFRIDISSDDHFYWTDMFSISVTDVMAERSDMPTTFVLQPNFPNPFNPSTMISYTLPQSGRVTLSIYNTFGQHIRTLVNEEQNAGAYSHVWNATDETGNKVSSGIYLYRIEFTDNTGREAWRAERKMLLLK